MSTHPHWQAQEPYATPPTPTLSPRARILLATLEAMAERDVARFPALAEAIRERKAREAAAREQEAS